jgi:putative transposase
MGLQISCCVYPQKAAEGFVWTGPALFGEIFHALARQKECQIIEGHVLPDHVHMCIAIPPKHPVASVIGFLKGKSAIAVARQLCGREHNFTGEHLWARVYAVSTVRRSRNQKKPLTFNQ